MRLVAWVISLLVGIAGLGYAATCETGGWSFAWMAHLFFWLPLTSILALAILVKLASRLKVSWFTTAAVIGAVALAQSLALAVSQESRITLAVMPLVLVAFAVMAIVSERGGSLEGIQRFASRHGRSALIGVVLVAIGATAIAVIHELNARRQAAEWKAEWDRKDRDLRGLERAAWLIGRVHYMSDYSEEQFLRDKSCRLRLWGEFRWDEERQRLIITQRLFDDDTRQRLLPQADAVLEHPLLKTGVRDDLTGGVLSCEPGLECRVEWTIDVDQPSALSDLNEQLRHNVDFIGRKLVRELAK